MNNYEFNKGIDLIVATFGDNPIKGPRLERIRELTRDKISGDGFYYVCRNICDNFRQTPLPSDFEKGIHDWRRSYIARYGKQYGEDSNIIDLQIFEIKCDKCNDLGIVLIKHHKEDNFESLMRCDCGLISDNEIKIPEWDLSLISAYKKTPCPLDWFKPNISNASNDIDTYSKIWDRVNFLKKKKENAISHWFSLGYK